VAITLNVQCGGAVGFIAWLDGLSQDLRHGTTKAHKKTMMSSDNLSGSSVDPRRMMNAATTNATKHASAAHQLASIMLAHMPMKNIRRTESRQQSDHNASHAGNKPRCC
jgi:hypothetical protein